MNMRFPFFKNAKEEPGTTGRPAIAVRPVNSLADTQPIHRLASEPEPGSGAGPCVSLPAAHLAPQLPDQMFVDQASEQLASVSLDIPVGLVLPQLASGKVSVKLSELIPLFPSQMLRSPLPPISDQQ